MKNLRKSLNISLFILVMVALNLFSCKPENEGDLPTPNPTAPTEAGSMKTLVNATMEEVACFAIAYPVNITMPDGSTQTANSEEELNAIYENWLASNPTDSIPPMLQYPLNVTLEDGSTLTVETEDELIELLEVCFEPEWEACFVFIYPITATLPDGTQTVANNDVELFAIFEDWYEQNPNSEEDPTLNYPISVQLPDGTVQAVNSDEEVEALFDNCEGIIEPGDPMECFTYVFPVTMQLPDGSQQLANSDEEILQIYSEWWENTSPDSIYPTVMPFIMYPYQVQLAADGSIVTVNNDEEFAAIIESCYGYSGGCGDSTVVFEDCFTFNFPLSLVMPDDSEVSVANEEEMFDVVIEWYEANPEDTTGLITFAFPISVTKDDGITVVTVNNEEELNALLEDCYGLLIDGEGIALGGQKANVATEALRQKIGERAGKNQVAKVLASGK